MIINLIIRLFNNSLNFIIHNNIVVQVIIHNIHRNNNSNSPHMDQSIKIKNELKKKNICKI